MIEFNEECAELIESQRCFILALQFTSLSPEQSQAVALILDSNERLAKVLDVSVPTMSEMLKQSDEIYELDRIYAR